MSLWAEDLRRLSHSGIVYLRKEFESKLQEKTIVKGNNCRIWKDDSNRYPRYWISKLQGQISLHVLVFYLYRSRIPELKNDVVSHLCSEVRCCNVNHLAIEPHQISVMRRVCHGTMSDKEGQQFKREKCTGHVDGKRLRRDCVL